MPCDFTTCELDVMPANTPACLGLRMNVAAQPEYEGFIFLLLQQAQAASVTDATPINQWAADVINGLIREVIPAKQDFDMVGPLSYT